MDNTILEKLEEQSKKIDELSATVGKMKKYMLFSLWFTIVMLVLPLIIGAFVVPYLISSYLSSFEGLL